MSETVLELLKEPFMPEPHRQNYKTHGICEHSGCQRCLDDNKHPTPVSLVKNSMTSAIEHRTL